MPLRLNDDWRIDGDTLNWTLKKRKQEKSGDYYWQAIGYFGSIEQACNCFLERQLRANSDSWKSVVKAVSDAIADIKGMCSELKMNYAEYVELKDIQNRRREEAVEETKESEEDWGFLE